MLNIAVENEKRIRSFCYPEYLSLIFFNYFSTTSFAIALKVFSSGRKRIFLLMESVQISPRGFVCEREES